MYELTEEFAQMENEIVSLRSQLAEAKSMIDGYAAAFDDQDSELTKWHSLHAASQARVERLEGAMKKIATNGFAGTPMEAWSNCVEIAAAALNAESEARDGE